jgi:ADP-ribose pyrophosphatase
LSKNTPLKKQIDQDPRPFIKRREIHRTDRIVLYRDTIVVRQRKCFRDWVRQPGVGAIVPLLDDGRILLVRQYRYGVNQTLWEIPAGTLDAGERPLTCAKRECEEETGHRPKRLKKLGSYVTSPAGTNEKVYVFLATDLVKTQMNLDPDEVLSVKAFSISQVKRMLKTQKIIDAKSIIGLHWFFENRK